MKRFICVFTVIIFFAFPLSLHADVVFWNDFFYENEDKTEDIGWESFIINSPSGYVIPTDEPGSGKGVPSNRGYKTNIYGDVYEPPKYNIFVFNNGEHCRIEAIYLYNGEYWGVMSPNHWYQPPGWILMDDLLVEYKREDFEKENENNFYTYTGSFDAVLSAEKIVLWEWPGSDGGKRIIDNEEHNMKSSHFLFAYKDSEGREWCKSSYTTGWICMSDPENKTDIPMFYPAPNPIKWSYDGSHDWTQEATVWPSAEPTAEVIASTKIGKPTAYSSKLSSAASQKESSVNSIALPSSDDQTNPIITTILMIAVPSVIVIGVVTIGLIFRAKKKKAK